MIGASLRRSESRQAHFGRGNAGNHLSKGHELILFSLGTRTKSISK